MIGYIDNDGVTWYKCPYCSKRAVRKHSDGSFECDACGAYWEQ